MAHQIHYTGTSEKLRQLLYGFVAAISNGNGSYAPYVQGIKLRIGMVALDAVQQSFAAKADGGIGDDGIHWLPLKKETIAQRPINLRGPLNDKPLLRSHGIKPYGHHERGFLTAAQNKRWKMIFATRKMWLMAKHGMSEKDAKVRAAQIAWSTLKREGAKTKLEVLGNRHVQIGRDTGRLFASLSPGLRGEEAGEHPVLEPPPPILDPAPDTKPDDRILREETAAVIVGSNVKYAERFHALRPLWPSGDLPGPWATRIENAAKSGVLEALVMIVEEQP